MELLAGENNMVTQARENGFAYQFDFSKVYWIYNCNHSSIILLNLFYGACT
jgi:hypothetical protein